MTSESKANTEPWIEAKQARYAYAYEKSGTLLGKLGFSGQPQAILLDPFGTVVWKGHPAQLDDDLVKKSLPGALGMPVFDWPDSAKAARKAFVACQVAKAIDEAKKLGAEGSALAASLEAHAAATLDALRALRTEGDYLAVEQRGALFTKRLAGLSQVSEIETLLAEVAKDDRAQDILAAQKRIQKMMSGKIKKGDIPNLRKDLQEIEQQFADTSAARDARAALVKLTKG